MNLYDKYHISRKDTRIGLFISLYKKYGDKRVLYPGCFVHVTPSFIFREVVYIDNMQPAAKFFESDDIKKIINQSKEYKSQSSYRFIQSDYSKVNEDIGKFDLLISQYAGFISQACKSFLNPGAILVVNNSHGDASMAYLDNDYTLIDVYKRYSDDKYTMFSEKLEEFFIPKNGIHPSANEIRELGRGIGYRKSPSGYIFRYKK